MQHPLRGVDKHFWYMFPVWRATWPGTSLDPEGGVTVLVQYCIQANDSLLVQLIILSAGEYTGRHRYPLYPRFSPYRVSKPVSQCKEKKIIHKLFMSTKIRASICGFYKAPAVWDGGFLSWKNCYTYITCSWGYESELEALQGSLPTLTVLRFCAWQVHGIQPSPCSILISQFWDVAVMPCTAGTPSCNVLIHVTDLSWDWLHTMYTWVIIQPNRGSWTC